ncbi:LysR family transcriptional regulator, partial [Actinomadura adrarensis]
MQLQQLAYFVAVAEVRHFTQAAEILHVAQPSLSKQIRALETELGASLFSRARGNITLTPAGETLL